MKRLILPALALLSLNACTTHEDSSAAAMQGHWKVTDIRAVGADAQKTDNTVALLALLGAAPAYLNISQKEIAFKTANNELLETVPLSKKANSLVAMKGETAYDIQFSKNSSGMDLNIGATRYILSEK